MHNQRDLELILRSRVPIVVIETRDESRLLDLLKAINFLRATQEHMPLFRWTVTDGLQRIDILLEPQLHNSEPTEVLRHIRAVSKPGIYVLLDFHPYLADPVNVRLFKDICMKFSKVARQLVLVSHEVELPRELESFSAQFDLALPTETERKKIVKRVAREFAAGSACCAGSVSDTGPSCNGTMARIGPAMAAENGCLSAKRPRSALVLAPKSPFKARSKNAARFGTRGTSSSRIKVVGRSTRLTCSIG